MIILVKNRAEARRLRQFDHGAMRTMREACVWLELAIICHGSQPPTYGRMKVSQHEPIFVLHI